MTSNTIYRDTFHLSPGCYELLITDTGKDGLSFFNNSDGSGYARLAMLDATPTVIKAFEPDFGTEISYRFWVGDPVAVDEWITVPAIRLYPNPSSGQFFIEGILPQPEDTRVCVYNLLGEKVWENTYENWDGSLLALDLQNYTQGMYWVNIQAGKHTSTQKWLKE